MHDQPPGRLGGIHQDARRNIRYDNDRDQPAEDKFDRSLEDDVGITGQVHYVVIAPNKSL